MIDIGSGVSSILSGYCLRDNGKGKIISLDHDKKYSKITSDFIQTNDLDTIVNINYSPLKEYQINGKSFLWYDIESIEFDEKIDLIIVDGPPKSIQKNSRYPAIPLLLNYLNDNCIILVDDYGREDEQRMVEAWISDYNIEVITKMETEKGF